ncbi:MAG: hypothetical protein LBV27_04260 [Oscillospiraceae bacterium]|nr:hypothetical protein [Oscillospiraceae bacterium]
MQIINQLSLDTVLFPASLSFVYVILPLLLALHHIFPARLRVGVLAVTSLLLYLMIQPDGLILMVVSVALDYIAVRLMNRHDDRQDIKRLCVIFSVVKNLVIIAVTGFLVQTRGVPLMLGTLIYTLSGMDAVIQMYKKECPYELDAIKFTLYCCFFPRLSAGPLYSYKDFDAQMINPSLSSTNLVYGVTAFLLGAVKALIIGAQLSDLYLQILDFPAESASVLSAWMLVIIFALAIFYIMSGLSEMAQGIGLMVGFKLPQNFYFPYQSRSVADFFERFNITAAAFIRKNVYKNLAGKAGKAYQDLPNLIVFGMLMGLWFGLRVNHMVWGLYLALFMFMEKYLYNRILVQLPTLMCRFYTLCVVLSSFTILSVNSLAQSVASVRLMFSFFSDSVPLYNNQIMYIMSSNWLLLLSSCVLATNLGNVISHWVRKTLPRTYTALNAAVSVVLLVLLTTLSL